MRVTREEFEGRVTAWLGDPGLMRALLSAPKGKEIARMRVTPVRVRGEAGLQLEYQEPGGRVRHANLPMKDAARTVIELMSGSFGQLNAVMWEKEAQAVAKKDAWLVTERDVDAKKGEREKPGGEKGHDRAKNRIIGENEALPFLVELGIMTREGRLRADMTAKFRQINRFLELVRDVLPELPKGMLRVLDFGCGKSYLTFALHHYLVNVERREVAFTGIDLKKDVIEHCESLAARTQSDMRFVCGDVNEVELEGADLVVSLHACDTATDAALACAVRLGASAVLSVPCCHHELAGQMECGELEILLRHGILRQRLCEIATDALRAQLLEISGYRAQVLEFIDPDATAKNLLIRAVKRKGRVAGLAAKRAKYRELVAVLGVDPALGRALGENVRDPADGGQEREKHADQGVYADAGKVVDD